MSDVRGFRFEDSYWVAFEELCEGRGVEPSEELRRLVLRELGLDEGGAVLRRGRPRSGGGPRSFSKPKARKEAAQAGKPVGPAGELVAAAPVGGAPVRRGLSKAEQAGGTWRKGKK